MKKYKPISVDEIINMKAAHTPFVFYKEMKEILYMSKRLSTPHVLGIYESLKLRVLKNIA